MSRYRIRIVCEAGADALGAEELERSEEVIEVDGASLWEARETAVRTMTIAAEGRQLLTYDADSGDLLKPPPPEGLRHGLFVIDGLPGRYSGMTRGNEWNGFAVPYFPLAEAQRVADDYASQPPTPDGQPCSEYDEARDAFMLYDPSAEEWDETSSVEVDGHALYPIGAHQWTWEEVGAIDVPGGTETQSAASELE